MSGPSLLLSDLCWRQRYHLAGGVVWKVLNLISSSHRLLGLEDCDMSPGCNSQQWLLGHYMEALMMITEITGGLRSHCPHRSGSISCATPYHPPKCWSSLEQGSNTNRGRLALKQLNSTYTFCSADGCKGNNTAQGPQQTPGTCTLAAGVNIWAQPSTAAQT